MTTIAPQLIGRFGNQLFLYAAARARAEREGHSFVCRPWIGQKVFDLNDELLDGQPDIWVDGYCQNQESLIYTRADCNRWFKFREDIVGEMPKTWPAIACHWRRGDYKDLGYVVVSIDSYALAASKNLHMIDWVYTEEIPWQAKSFEGELSFLPDFFGMTRAKVLYRANSSFSWWAAVLSNAEVWSPVIDGLVGGKEHDCQFVKGNWPKFANLPNITDLHLRER